MPRQSKTKPAVLTINSRLPPVLVKSDGSPDPKSSPMNLEGIDLSSFGGDIGMDGVKLPPLPLSPPIPLSPSFPQNENKSHVVPFKSRAISEPEVKDPRSQIRQVKDDEDYRPSSSSVSKIYHLRKNPGSTPELSLVGSRENVRKQSAEGNAVPLVRPQPSPQNSEDNISVKRREKGFRNPLSRSKSIRRDSNSKSKPNGLSIVEQAPKTAPISADWQNSSEALLKAKGKDRRGKSAERAVTSESDDNNTMWDKKSTRDGGRGFVSGSKNVMSKAVTGGGNFLTRLGKVGRSGSNTTTQVPDSEYKPKIIKLPLIEQTRITRISKDLAKCRDKTEYWMPSLPWRCIDYLNQNCESEGLYRVPGSGPQIKHWQRRFDVEGDINLLDEKELYDPNNIGSLLKAWLRDQPTPIMAKELQHSLADAIETDNPEYQKVGQPAPQKLRDALSNMPPFNYYLLFAVTCHLSLLLSHQDKNKMDLHNLFICVGPGLNLERWLFNYLVGDWRHCWQGCFTEKQYLEAERAYEQGYEYAIPTTSNGDQEDYYDEEELAIDERPVRSRGQGSSRSRATSPTGSRYEDARSAQHSPVRGNENSKPDTCQPPALPAKYVNGSTANLNQQRQADQDQRRPATAGKHSESGVSSVNTPTNKPVHARSKSDYQLSPMKPSSPVDFPFSLRDA